MEVTELYRTELYLTIALDYSGFGCTRKFDRFRLYRMSLYSPDPMRDFNDIPSQIATMLPGMVFRFSPCAKGSRNLVIDPFFRSGL